MELREAIQSRTSVRRYTTAPSVGNDIIQDLVALGMRAPSPKNRQPWQVIHVTGAEKDFLLILSFKYLNNIKREKSILVVWKLV